MNIFLLLSHTTFLSIKNSPLEHHTQGADYLHLTFLIHIYRCAVRERYAVGLVEGFEVYFLVEADAQSDGNYCPEKFPVPARIQRRRRKFVPAFLLTKHTDLPDIIVRSLIAEPRFQHVADAEAFILTSEEAPCALQQTPELHKAFLIVFDCNHLIFDFDQMTLTK